MMSLGRVVFAVLLVSGLVLQATIAATPAETDRAKAADLGNFDQIVTSPRDLWGEAAMRQPNGPSYEFFEGLLPPLRYVNADFRFYPIVLCAPRTAIKARLISNGSGVNLCGGVRSFNDIGTPVVFRVGPDEFRFGALLDRLSQPTLAEGWLPIVEIRYLHPTPVQAGGNVPVNQGVIRPTPEVYRLEAFCSTDPALADSAVVFVKFSLAEGASGTITADIEAPKELKLVDGRALDEQGRALAYFDPQWKWDRGSAHAKLTPGTAAVMAVPTKPLDGPGALKQLSEVVYQEQRQQCAKTWKQLIGQGMQVETPEPYVNNAWRNLLVQNYQMLSGDRILYSAGNQYGKLYEAEGSDAALAMMVWGGDEEMRRMIVPLLDFTRKGLEYHQAGLKLHDVCALYWQTRDAAFIESLRPRWSKEVTRIVEGRTEPNGLFPKEQYCGDISTPVHSLSAVSKAWRGLHDMVVVLKDMGRQDEAAQLAAVATEFRESMMAAVQKSLRRETTPPFVPIALLGDESIHDPIVATRIGSYWNLVINYVIGSRIFPPGSPEDTWIPRYLEQHGGLTMGMTRAGGGEYTFWNSEHRINPLYGTRYVVDTLRRDDPERALVSLYGMLAQGMTRNTFVCGEGAVLTAIDPGGRFFYCPPNSAGNAYLLTILRNLLVQDFDLDNDGRPETLRLLFATPRRWLEDGKQIRVERAPTAFGPVSISVQSNLGHKDRHDAPSASASTGGEVLAEVDLPERNQPKQTLLRIRLPEGWRVTSASVGAESLAADDKGTIDLTGRQGHVSLRFAVRKEPSQ